jgi:DNA-binding NarL/FixJ family response regulator
MRVVLCDDHPVYRAGLRMLLEELSVEIVGEAASGERAVDLCADLQPDIVIMDLHLPGIGGVEATRQIVSASPGVRVLVLTMLDDDVTLLAALRAGAGGYLLKGANHLEISRALDAVAAGDIVIGAAASPRLRAGLRGAPDGARWPQLTSRERQILDLVARGRGNEHIAQTLFLSTKTVRNNVSSILAKLGATSRAEVVAMVRDDAPRPAGGTAPPAP